MANYTGRPNEHVPIDLAVDLSSYRVEDREALKILVDAVSIMDRIFCQQTNQKLSEQGGVFDKTKPSSVYPL